MSEEIKNNIESFLTFKLGKEIFAVNVEKVLEILEVPSITSVPRSPEYMKGVINLRGNVLPVIDSRIKFGMPPADQTINTCIVVLNVEMDAEEIVIGALVDSVQEVLEIKTTDIQPSPSIGSKYKAEFINGMYKLNEVFVIMLNIDKVFSADELIIVKETTVAE
jgi:purine-binding chemotaxis protein CheW